MKTALVTGGTSEIGKEICKVLATNNINIIVHYNEKEKEANELKSNIEKEYKVKCICIKADLKNEEEINNLYNTAIKEFNKIDILINNAAIDLPNLYNSKTKKEFSEVIDVNLIGPFLLSRLVGDQMLKNGYGKIINISSTNGIDTYYPMCLDYDASKAALNSLTHNLALQYKPIVNVNAIAPGWVETKKDLEDLDSNYIEEEKDKIFKGRFAKPIEIAYLVEFLVSEKGEYINNQIIRLDGGMY